MAIRQKIISLEESEKKIIVENVRNEAMKRKLVFLGIVVLFFIIKAFLKPFPYYYHSVFICFFMLYLIFPTLKYIEKHSDLSLQQIQKILTAVSILEMICVFFLLYFFLPIGIYYVREVVLVITPFLAVFFITTYPIIRSKKYNNLFLLLCFLVLALIGMLQYKRIFPIYDSYPIAENMISFSGMILGSVLGGGIFFFIIGEKLNYYWELLTEGNLELRKLNLELEEGSKELEKERLSLDSKVNERTKELEKSQEELKERVEELERFRKISVGRELKMIELKKEIEKLRN